MTICSCVLSNYCMASQLHKTFIRFVSRLVNIFHLGICPALSLTNGVVGSYDRSPGGGLYPPNTRVSITCNSGFHGPSEVQCYEGGSWGPYPPGCHRGNQ